jgi:hypothetical protein
MSTSWEKRWPRYQLGLITASELVEFVFSALQDTNVATLVASLPEGYRDILGQQVQSGAVPSKLLYFNGASPEESRELHQAIREDNQRAVEDLRRFFEADGGGP